MDESKWLVIIKGEDQTAEVSGFSDEFLGRRSVGFRDKKLTYSYALENIEIIECDKVLSPERYEFKRGGEKIEFTQAYAFGRYIKIKAAGGDFRLHLIKDLEINALPCAMNALDDLMAYLVSLVMELGEDDAPKESGASDEARAARAADKELRYKYARQFSEIDDNRMSAFTRYALGVAPTTAEAKDVIFPFGASEVQRTSVRRALSYDMSVIESESERARLSAILNIVANIVIAKRTIALVYNSKDEVRAAQGYLNEVGLGFITADICNAAEMSNRFDKLPSIDEVEDWALKPNSKSVFNKFIRLTEKKLIALKRSFGSKSKTEKDIIDATRDLEREMMCKSHELFVVKLLQLYNDILYEDFDFTSSIFEGRNYSRFVMRYPVVLCAANELVECSGKGYLYDCVIINDADCVNLIDAAVALSAAKNAVLIGSGATKPQPFSAERAAACRLPAPYAAHEHSLLESVKRLYKDSLSITKV